MCPVHMQDEEWVVRSTGGTTFEEVDLSEGEFMDVCEKTSEPVTISEFESKFELYKGK